MVKRSVSSTAAAAGTVYLYTLQPTLFIAGATASCNLIISNPAASAEVSALRAKRGRPEAEAYTGPGARLAAAAGDSITVLLPQGAPTAQNVLVPSSDASQISPLVISSPVGQPWTSSLILTTKGYQIKVWPIGGGSLGAGQSVTVQISNIAVTPTSNAPVVTITETVAGGNPATTTLNTIVTAASLNVVANAVPATVGLGQSTVLQWSAMGGSTITITDGSSSVQIPLQGPGPIYSGQTPVLPFQDARQTTFTLTVATQDNQTQTYLVVVTLSPPVIRLFEVSPQGSASLDATVRFTWDVDYATQVFFTPAVPPGTGQVLPAASQSVVPRKLYPGGSNQSALPFTLTAKGYQPTGTKTVSQTRTLDLSPAQILYFGYTDLQTKGVRQSVVNGFPAMSGPDPTGLYTLNVTGPAGPLTQYLGPGPYLEIQYFGAAPSPSPAPGTSVQLTWLTQNATSLVLNPGNIPVTSNAQGSGSYTVSPASTTTYILTARQGNNQVTSQVTVVVQGSAASKENA